MIKDDKRKDMYTICGKMRKVDNSYKTNVREKHIALNEYETIFITFQINNIITLKCYGQFRGVLYLELVHIRKK